MYKLTEEQRNTMLYILDRLSVTGPTQGGLLNNAGVIIRSLQPYPQPKKEES